MDFYFSDTVNRHLKKIKHECDLLLKNGVFQPELSEHTIIVPMFSHGENISEDEIDNVKRLYQYLSNEKIAVGNLPLHPKASEGTLDYFKDGENVFEYITVEYVNVFDYDKLCKFVNDRIFKVGSLEMATFKHLKGRALDFDGEFLVYHSDRVKSLKASQARSYLLSVLALIREEEGSVDCAEIALFCGESEDGATKRIKDALNQTVAPKLKRLNKKLQQPNFVLDTSIDDVVHIVNPRLYKSA